MDSKYIQRKKKRDYSYEITEEHLLSLSRRADAIVDAYQHHIEKYGVSETKPVWPQFDERDLEFGEVIDVIHSTHYITEAQHRQLRITIEKMFGNDAQLEDELWPIKNIYKELFKV